MHAKDVCIGSIFSKLTVIELIYPRTKCMCECGGYSTPTVYALVSGNSKSCGCAKYNALRLSRTTHGRSNSRLTGYADRTYGIWQAIKDRCTNPNRVDWPRYGGAGITVCERWAQSFEAFVEDMGDAPEGLTIDRIDYNRGYSPDNCRWATYKAQGMNTKKAIVYELDGKRDTVNGWATHWGIRWEAAKKRLDSEAIRIK